MIRIFSRLPQSIKQMIIYGSALVLSKAMSLVMIPVFTNYLEPADYGRLDILQTLANLLSIVIAFGLSESLFRFSGEAKNKNDRVRTTANIFGLAVLLGGISLVLTQLFAPIITLSLPGSVSELQVRLILGSLALSGVILVPMSFLRMSDRAIGYTLASAGCAVIQAFLTALLLYLGYGLEGVLLSGLLCISVLAVCLFIYQVRNTGISFKLTSYPRYGHFGGVLVFAGISAFIMDSFPRWILAGSVGTAEMAIFALAGKLALITAFMVHPFEMWWMPKRFTVLNTENGLEACARSTQAGIVNAMAAALVVSAISPFLIITLTPDVYHGAVMYVPALAFIMAMNSSVNMINIGCLSKERTLWPLIIDGSAATLACLGYFILIPMFGAWGVIAMTVTVMCGRVLAYFVVGHKIKAIPYAYGRLALFLAGTVLSITTVSMLGDTYLALAAGLFLAGALVFVAFLFKLLPPFEFKLAKSPSFVEAQ